jgi:hypothetical protein
MRAVTQVLQKRPTDSRKLRTRSMDQNALLDACGLLTPKIRKPRKVHSVSCDKENLPEIKSEALQSEELINEKPRLCVMFDTESTGVGTKTAEIIQIAAMPIPDDNHECAADLDSFNRFLLPEIPIHWGASMVHTMKMRKGRLVRGGEEMQVTNTIFNLGPIGFSISGRDSRRRAEGVLRVVLRAGGPSRVAAAGGAQWGEVRLPAAGQCGAKEGRPSARPAPQLKVQGHKCDFQSRNKYHRVFILRLADSLPACKPCRQEFGSCKLAVLKENLVPVSAVEEKFIKDLMGDLETHPT